jgi:imidazoleglycerol phosphate dehydratase HisB
VAYRSLASDVRTGKRRASTLVWQLENHTHHTIDCVAMTYGDGLVYLCTEKAGVREDRGVFPDARAAVRSALDLERSFMSDGWAKVV